MAVAAARAGHRDQRHRPRRDRSAAAGHAVARSPDARHRHDRAESAWAPLCRDGSLGRLRGIYLRPGDRHAIRGDRVQPPGTGRRGRCELPRHRSNRPGHLPTVRRRCRGSRPGHRKRRTGRAELHPRRRRIAGRFPLPADRRVAPSVRPRHRQPRLVVHEDGRPGRVQMGPCDWWKRAPARCCKRPGWR